MEILVKLEANYKLLDKYLGKPRFATNVLELLKVGLGIIKEFRQKISSTLGESLLSLLSVDIINIETYYSTTVNNISKYSKDGPKEKPVAVPKPFSFQSK